MWRDVPGLDAYSSSVWGQFPLNFSAAQAPGASRVRPALAARRTIEPPSRHAAEPPDLLLSVSPSCSARRIPLHPNPRRIVR